FVDLQAVCGQHIGFSLYKNGSQVQSASSDDMIFTIDKIIAYVSRYMTLKIGDLIYTGTPSGVGTVAIGDNLRGLIGDKEMFDFFVR
ncbi:MAG: 2-hydroxyhepta-2,4-diene-1,7-dioate isomerase, partial [Bacteroidetes bacterium]